MASSRWAQIDIGGAPIIFGGNVARNPPTRDASALDFSGIPRRQVAQGLFVQRQFLWLFFHDDSSVLWFLE